jgi:chemotaxis receptor (MCP) glutamine deamidase CheD
VAACIHDPVVRVGGMNHFLLPGEAGSDVRHGVHAMELLVNGLLTHGDSKSSTARCVGSSPTGGATAQLAEAPAGLPF